MSEFLKYSIAQKLRWRRRDADGGGRRSSGAQRRMVSEYSSRVVVMPLGSVERSIVRVFWQQKVSAYSPLMTH